MSNYILTSNGELYHYGIKGQKWGVRRYQNADGTLTAAGKKRAKQEYRADNKTAYELGKAATVYGYASARSINRTIRLENKLDKQYAKDPDGVRGRTKRLRGKWDASAKTALELAEAYNKHKTKAEKHCKDLIDKYGEEAVSSIKYKDAKLRKGKYSPDSVKIVNERTNNLSDWALAGGMTLTSAAMTMTMGVPITMIFAPTTTIEKANRLESVTYYRNKRK